MNNTNLKIIAMTAMLLDHIWVFNPNFPYIFHIIGRISAPIFIYCSVEAFKHTQNKYKYILRLYLLSLIMSLINGVMFETIGDDYYLNFARSLFILSISLLTMETFSNNNIKLKRIVISFWIFQIIFFIIICTGILAIIIPNSAIMLMLFTILGTPLILEGGIFFVILGIFMYIFYDFKFKTGISFCVLTIIYMLMYNTSILIELPALVSRHFNIDIDMIFTDVWELLEGNNPHFISIGIMENPQWLMLLALPIILLYNHKKGKGYKWLFYSFYPMHILVLYILSLR